MDNELLAQILDELREIKQDLRWFKEREERKQKAARDGIEDFAKRLTGRSQEG